MEEARQILALAVVACLLGAVCWRLRRAGLSQRGAAAATLRSAGRLSLTPQHCVHLVRVADRGLLIATHAGGCTLLESFCWRQQEDRPAPDRQRLAEGGPH